MFLSMISLAETRALIGKNISPLPAQTASLADAFRRVLRENICAPEDLPAFDRSAMDGYAIMANDDSKQFRVVVEIQPGAVPKFKINRGECARIFTGAQIPEGAAQVLMQENVRVVENFIAPLQHNRATFVRKRGEDARKGDLLLKNGTRLGIGELALLASFGVTQPQVSPLVRVAHFVTGNELVAPSQTPQLGQIRDSNSTLVAAFVRQFDGTIVKQERVIDDFDLLFKQVCAIENDFDLLLISGGASVGGYDFGRKLLNALGFQIHFEKINLRPGKPLIFATHGNQAAFVLPGNPVSHFVTLHVAVRLALENFSGAKNSWLLAKIRLAENFEFRPDARETFWPARVEIQNGELVVRALRWQSSGDVTGLAGVNALLQFSGDTKTPKSGDVIPVLLLEIP
jgi:molybdopterin molybdotransferase